MTRLAQVVFALLVAATFGAFFVAQRLKGAESVAEITRVKRFFSPNGDGRRDVNRIAFTVTEAGSVTVTIVDRDGERVRRVTDGIEARPGTPVRVVWDGRTDEGLRAPDGLYRMQVGLRRTGRTVIAAGSFNVDTTAPRPVVLSVKPPIAGPVPGSFEIRARGVGTRRAPRFRILRTDVTPVTEVARFRGRPGSRRGVWNGLAGARPAPPGTYMVVVAVRDRSGNEGTAPAVLPPVRGQVRGKPGITVRQITAQPPLEPVRAGERVEFFVDSRRRSYRWSIRRVGIAHPVKKGSAVPGRTLAVRAPRDASGAYLLELRSGRYSARVPFLVQAPERARLLVVVPAISWLGVDKVDDDGDGLPDTLETGGPVEWPRVLVGDQGLPATFADQTAPLLVFLDRAHIRYDLTSDIALARSRDPRATDREGVVLAGSLRWVPRPLARRLRRYVEDGGRLASFGTESLRRGRARGAEPPLAPDAADADRPVRRAPRAAHAPARRRTRRWAGAADRARRRPDPGAPDRLRRRGRRVRPARGVAGAGGAAPGEGRDGARPGRDRGRARRGGGRGRAAAPRIARADRDAAREGLSSCASG